MHRKKIPFLNFEPIFPKIGTKKKFPSANRLYLQTARISNIICIRRRMNKFSEIKKNNERRAHAEYKHNNEVNEEIKQQQLCCEIVRSRKSHRIELERAQIFIYVYTNTIANIIDEWRNSKTKEQNRRKHIANDHDDDAMMVYTTYWRGTNAMHKQNILRKNRRISRTREKWNWIFSQICIRMCVCQCFASLRLDLFFSFFITISMEEATASAAAGKTDSQRRTIGSAECICGLQLK